MNKQHQKENRKWEKENGSEILVVMQSVGMNDQHVQEAPAVSSLGDSSMIEEELDTSFTNQQNSTQKKKLAQKSDGQKKLKSKEKQIGKLEKKVKKLEGVFIEKSNYAKLLEKDRETLLTFIEIAMKHKNKQDFRKNQIGQYSLDQLLAHFQIQDPQSIHEDEDENEETKSPKPEVQIENLTNQLDVQKSKNSTLTKKCQVQEQQIANLKAQNILKVFRSTLKQDPQQQLEMQKKISSQSTEILKLKDKLCDAKNKITDLECSIQLANQERQDNQQQHQNKNSQQKIKYEPTLQVFESSSPQFQNGEYQHGFEEQKEQLIKSNSSLQSSLNSTVQELNNLKVKMAQITQAGKTRHSINYGPSPPSDNDQKIFFDLDDNVPKIRKLQQKIRDLESVIQLQMDNEKITSSRIKDFQKMKSFQNINIQYLKNIILKYMEYIAQKNLKQAETLEYVIFTVLQCQRDDLKKLSTLREKTGILKYFKPKGMAPPNQARAEKYSSQSSFQRNRENLSQSVIHTSRQEYRNSLGDLNKSMYGHLNTERGIKSDQNIFNS